MRGKHEAESPYDFSANASGNVADAIDRARGSSYGGPKDAVVWGAAARGLAYDIVYNPLETRFLREARLAGRHCLSGLEMFYGQADASSGSGPAGACLRRRGRPWKPPLRGV